MEGHSAVDVMKAVSDSRSFNIFLSIGKGTIESEILKGTKGLSKKQYYLRTRRLLKVGLVRRKKGRFSLTAFGAIVYQSQLVIESGVKNFWKLKAIDSIQASGKIGEDESVKLIKTIIEDTKLEKILVTKEESR